jgi:hypothetical protein
MHTLAAASVSVSGIDGFLQILAVIFFAIAVIVAAISVPRNWWAVGIAAGLLCWVLTLIVH